VELVPQSFSVSSSTNEAKTVSMPTEAIQVVTFTRPSSTLQSIVFPSKTSQVVSAASSTSSSFVIASEPFVEANKVEDNETDDKNEKNETEEKVETSDTDDKVENSDTDDKVEDNETEDKVEIIVPTIIEASEVEPVIYSSTISSSESKPLPSVSLSSTSKVNHEENLVAIGEKKTSIATPASKKGEKIGLISQLQETRVEDGTTKLYETNVIGTHIGTNYVRLFQSTAHVLATPSVIGFSNENEDFITEQSVHYSASNAAAISNQDKPDLNGDFIRDGHTYEHDMKIFLQSL